MARLVFAPAALHDIDRLSEFLRDQSGRLAAETEPLLIEGLEILKRHPLIGRPVESGLREMLISRGRSGYAALYRYSEHLDTAIVLAIRHQSEAGYGG